MSHWAHISLPDLVEATVVQLKQVAEDQWVGTHPHRHDSRTGECLVVTPTWYWCSSCKAGADAADWLVDCGEAETMNDAAALLIEKYGVSPEDWTEPVLFPPSYPDQVWQL